MYSVKALRRARNRIFFDRLEYKEICDQTTHTGAVSSGSVLFAITTAWFEDILYSKTFVRVLNNCSNIWYGSDHFGIQQYKLSLRRLTYICHELEFDSKAISVIKRGCLIVLLLNTSTLNS